MANDILQPHSDEKPSHNIADHTRPLQTSVFSNGKWYNIGNTLDFMNAQHDMHKVAKVVEQHQVDITNAEKEANNAHSEAQSAIQVSKVNSAANSAMSAAVDNIHSLANSAATDAAKIRADVAQVQNEVDTAKAANSASVEALKSDVSAAKQDLADVHDSLTKAQAAAEESQKLINDNVTKIASDVSATQQDLAGVRKDLTKAQSDITANQKSINDNVAQINADITQDRKDIANAQQANADTAKQLDTYSKQAAAQGKTINSIQDKQDGFTATLADVQGNVSQVSDKVDGLSASLKDTQGNVATVKAQADQLNATLTDHAKSIATLTASAKELSSTLEDADGRLSKVEQTAKMNSSTLSDVQGDLSQVKQSATVLTATLKDAQGNISTLQQKADSVSAQLASAQGDIATLQTGVDGVKATLASHDKTIHTLQADSKTLKDDMVDAQGNISSLQKNSIKLDSEMYSQDGRLSKVEQTAKEHTTTISDLGDKLNNMKIGGRNLLLSTSADEKSGKAYGFADYQISGGLQPGTTYTLSGWARVDQTAMDHKQWVFIDVYSEDWSWWVSLNINSSLTAQYNKLTFTTPTGKSFSPVVTIYLSHPNNDNSKDSISGQGFISKLKLEEGNVATDWTPAPEDLATVTQVKQTADGIETTLKSAQGDIDQIEQKTNGTSEQLADVKGDVTNIQKDVTGLKQTTADNAGNIHTLQSDSKTLKDDMQDAQGDISTLKKTSTDVTAELQDHAGRISKTEQTASTLVNELADQQGHLNRVEQTAQGTQQTVANQQGQINSIQTDVSGIHETITGQGNQITTINATLNGLDTKYEGVSGDLNNLKSQSQWVTVTDTVDLNNIKTPCHEFLKGAVTNAPNETAWWYLTVEGSEGDRITQTVIADQSNNRYTRRWTDGWSAGWSAWVKDATQTDVTALSNRITTNSTQITQNKQAIALKADQATVSNLSGQVSQAQAQLEVQAGQISSKVDSTTVNGLIDERGYATTSAVQSWINQKSDTISETITRLDDKVNTTGGGVNLARNTKDKESVGGLNTSNNIGGLSLEQWNDLRGKTITISVDTQWSGWSFGNNCNNRIGWEICLIYQDGNKDYFGPWTSPKTANGKDRPHITFTVRDEEIKSLDEGTSYIQANCSSAKVSNLKIELGSIATPYSSAPSDDASVTQIQNLTAAIDGIQSTVRGKADQSTVTQLSNVIDSKVAKGDYNTEISQLNHDINLRVQKGQTISQINQEAGGNTLIEVNNGKGTLALDASTVTFSGKAFIPDAAIAHLSLDKLTTGHITVPIADKYGNQIELGNDGINIISGLVVEDSANSGSASSNSGSDSFQKLGYGVKLTSSGLKMYQHRQYNVKSENQPKSEDFTLLDINPIKSPASNDSKRLPEGLAFMIQTQKYSSVLGPDAPHNFLALGRRYYKDSIGDTGTDFYDVVYSAEDGNGYNVGLHVNTSLYTKPYGADHGIRTAWVSWSNWDSGQKYPAIVNDTENWGGIAFPSSGKATIFDASGHTFWPTQSYGHYNGYGG